MLQAQSALGLVALLFLAWALSEERRPSAWRIAVTGAVLQLVLAVLMLYLPGLAEVIAAANRIVAALDAATEAGTSLVFGYLGGGPLPFEEGFPGASFVFAFRALPIILVVSALAALLTYWRILPFVVRVFGRLLERSFRIGGPVGLASAANVLLGMIEAPLLVRPYLSHLSRSELFVLMTTGMATIAGTVYVLYSLILAPVLPDAASQLLIASVISAPAAVTVALLMVPRQGPPIEGRLVLPRESAGAMDAVVRGVERGVTMLIAIVAMLIVFVALVHLANTVLGTLPDLGEAPDHPATDPLLAPDSGRLAARRAVGRVPHGGAPAGDEGRAQRARGLSRPREAAGGSALRAQPAHSRLCPVRVRQPRRPRHHDRRHIRPSPRAPGRDRGARSQEPFRRIPGHLPDRHGHRHPDPGALNGGSIPDGPPGPGHARPGVPVSSEPRDRAGIGSPLVAAVLPWRASAFERDACNRRAGVRIATSPGPTSKGTCAASG